MGYSDSISGFVFFTGIISLIVIITFFVMAFRLRKIKEYLASLYALEELKPENQKQVKCDKCGKEYSVIKVKTGFMFCAECKHNFKVGL
jgi:hypothetical protein